ncbi:hypothetical protein QAD02_006782 [Eretmocerus hayati]|uniref:Uncharacterized protein n=1 Tax=Eretmocerus hayati TaxID=131215 RepID=A0ACC2N1V9_9HYME|nr:hypothetical protein QAD02_006782 [Eretmocerus hayati]
MSVPTDAAAQKIQDKLKDVFKIVHGIDNVRSRSESDIQNLEKLKSEAASEQHLMFDGPRRLRGAYTRAMVDAKKEESLLRDALDQINDIRTIRKERRLQARSAGNKETIRRGTLMKMLLVSAQTLPLYVGEKPGIKAPPLCGALPAKSDYRAKVGDMVAALVKGLEMEETWILAEVINYDSHTNKYEVEDVDEEEKEKHIVSRSRVVPLPLMRANPETDAHALFPNGAKVMALYPQTTCFYSAVVKTQPATAADDYELLFEDSNYPGGYSPPLMVPQRYIISIDTRSKSRR